MHHPDIHDILLIIKDYSILTSSNLKFQINPTIYTKPSDRNKPNEDVREHHGLKIIHQLNQGRIEINITGFCDDYD